jgi:hypothetical protein
LSSSKLSLLCNFPTPCPVLPRRSPIPNLDLALPPLKQLYVQHCTEVSQNPKKAWQAHHKFREVLWHTSSTCTFLHIQKPGAELAGPLRPGLLPRKLSLAPPTPPGEGLCLIRHNSELRARVRNKAEKVTERKSQCQACSLEVWMEDWERVSKK